MKNQKEQLQRISSDNQCVNTEAVEQSLQLVDAIQKLGIKPKTFDLMTPYKRSIASKPVDREHTNAKSIR